MNAGLVKVSFAVRLRNHGSAIKNVSIAASAAAAAAAVAAAEMPSPDFSTYANAQCLPKKPQDVGLQTDSECRCRSVGVEVRS